MEDRKARNARKRNGAIIAVVFLALLLLIAYGQQHFSGSKYENTVKTASPADYPDKTYGDAFDTFFKDGKWEVFQQKDKSYIVQFSGVCTYKGVSDYTLIQFMVGDIPETSVSDSSAVKNASQSSSISSSLSGTSGSVAETVSAQSEEDVQIHMTSIRSTNDVHVIYVGLNEEELSDAELQDFWQAIFQA